MANEHIEVENKKKVQIPERRYIIFYTDKDGMLKQSSTFQNRQLASDHVYDLIQKSSRDIIVYQEVPYRIQI